jgi:hypothetical protein
MVRLIRSDCESGSIRNELKKDNDKFAFYFNFIADWFFSGDANPKA